MQHSVTLYAYEHRLTTAQLTHVHLLLGKPNNTKQKFILLNRQVILFTVKSDWERASSGLDFNLFAQDVP